MRDDFSLWVWGDAAIESPFDRASLAGEVGKGAFLTRIFKAI